MFHQVTIVGFIGKNPEMRYSPTGQAVTNFSIATSRKWTDPSGEKKTETTWFHISAFGKLGEVTNQYLTKGSKALILGHLHPDAGGNPRVWNRQDGSAGASYEIIADTVRFLGSPQDENGQAQEQRQGQGTDGIFDEDSIPF